MAMDIGSAHDLADARRSPGYVEAVRSFAEGTTYDRFGTKVTSRAALRRLAEIATEQPDKSGEDIVVEAGYAVDPSAHYDDQVAPVMLARSTLVDDPYNKGASLSRAGLVRALWRALPSKPSLAEVAAAVKADVVDVLSSMPRSDWRRAIPSQAKVEMVYVPDLDDEDGPDARRGPPFPGPRIRAALDRRP